MYLSVWHYNTRVLLLLFFLVTFLVLRLDNVPEPYDVSFGNSSYYSSNVNDSSMAAGRENARDGIPMDNIPPLRTSI